MKIARYYDTRYNFEQILEVSDNMSDSEVRLSNIVEVDLAELPNAHADKVNGQVEQINKRIEEKRVEKELEIEALIDKRNKLLAISNDG